MTYMEFYRNSLKNIVKGMTSHRLGENFYKLYMWQKTDVHNM
jgi:hypothetical protein